MTKKIGEATKKIEKAKGPSLDSKALKTQLIDDVMGVEAIDFGLGIGEVLTSTSSLKNLQQQSEIQHNFSEWLDSIHKTRRNEESEEQISAIPILAQLNVNQNELNDLVELNANSINDNEVKINVDDIQEEVDFWNPVVICYVAGSNPLIQVMTGFFRCIWKKLGIDKVALLKKGIYIVRF